MNKKITTEGIETVLHSFSIVAVNCFVLITGYFLCTAEFNYKKILNLWIQVEVYSIGIYLMSGAC